MNICCHSDKNYLKVMNLFWVIGMDIVPDIIQTVLFFFQFPVDSSSTLPYPLNMKSMKHEAESDGSDGIDSAGICVHESTQV